MIDVQLLAEPASIRAGTLGPATGNIWAVFGGRAFPFQHWNDFVLVILEALITAVLHLMSGARAVERVHFMEGPYALELVLGSDDVLQINAIERRAGPAESLNFSGQIRLSSFISSLIETTETVLNVCREKGVSQNDAMGLDRAFLLLRERIES